MRLPLVIMEICLIQREEGKCPDQLVNSIVKIALSETSLITWSHSGLHIKDHHLKTIHILTYLQIGKISGINGVSVTLE